MSTPGIPATATMRRAPGPGGHVLLGSLLQFRSDTIGLLEQSARIYGDVVRFRLGPITAHLLNHPKHVEHVLRTHAHNYDKQTRSVAKIRATCGNSLLSSEGEAWNRHRRLIQPAFQRQRLDPFVPVIVEQTENMLQHWHVPAHTKEPIDVVSEMMHLTLRIAARILFGTDIGEDADVIERSLSVVMRDTWRRLESPMDMSTVSPVFHRPQFRRALRGIDDVVYRIIEDRRRQASESDDLLAMLLAAHEAEDELQLGDEELRDAVITLLLAGHETTANALAWTFFLISQAPDVEQRLGEDASIVDPCRLAPDECYAGMVFREAIRLYPSVWILERRAVRDDTVGGFHIPAGSTVMISPYVLHRHPDFWDAPERFDPERFSSASDANRTRYSYIPFGAGAHQCVGQNLALRVATLILSLVSGQFHLQLVSGQCVDPQPGITLQHAGGLRMTLQAIS